MVISPLATLLFGLILFQLFSHLREFPALYNDEGFYLRLGAERARGLPYPLSLAFITSVSPQFPMTPAWGIVLGWLGHWPGDALMVGRVFAALSSVLLVIIGACLTRRIAGWFAVIGMLWAYSVVHYFWYFGREIIPHGFTSLLLFGSFSLLLDWRIRGQRWALFTSVLLATTGGFMSYWAFYFILCFPVAVATARRHYRFLGIVPLLALLLFWLERLIRYGKDFLTDFHNLFFWMASGGVAGDQTPWLTLLHPVANAIILSVTIPIHALGMVGFFFLRDRWLRRALIGFSLASILFVFRDREVFNTPYLTLFTLPFSTVGVGVFLARFGAFLGRQTRSWKRITGIVAVIVVLGVGLGNALHTFRVAMGKPVEAGATLLTNVYDAAAYVIPRASASDYVITPVEIYWLLPMRSVEQTFVYGREFGRLSGEVGEYFRSPYRTDDRYFSYPTAVRFAKYVIVQTEILSTDSSTYVGFSAIHAYLSQQVKDWPIVYHNQLYTILANPSIAVSTSLGVNYPSSWGAPVCQ